MQRRYVVVVPVKPPGAGKSRLSAVGETHRRALATAFALDTVAACRAAQRVEQVVVATDDDDLAALVEARGCHVVRDGEVRGLNPVLRAAAEQAHVWWPDLVPVALLADVPAVRPEDLDAVLLEAEAPSDRDSGSHPEAGSGVGAFVPDATGTGTTLFTAAYDAFVPRFGPGSAAAHAAAGARPVGHALARLRRDVDDLDDLVAARELGLGEATAAVMP